MTQKLALEKLQELVNNKVVFKSSNAYKTALAAINSPGVHHVAGKNTGSGKHSSSTSWKTQVETIFRLIGLDYKATNVAPFGGKSGDRILAILETEEGIIDVTDSEIFYLPK